MFRKRKDQKSGVALTEKICAFIEEAKFVGSETPAPKYEVVYVREIFITFIGCH